MEKIIRVDDTLSVREIFGIEDKNVRVIEREFRVKVSLRPQGIAVKGEEDKVESAAALLNKMMELKKQGVILNERDLRDYLNVQQVKNTECAPKVTEEAAKSGIKVASIRKEYVFPRTKGQQTYIHAMSKHDIVLSIGPAGTGKTYLAMAMAVYYLLAKRVRRIILTRPAIEAGESLGFLPGDMYEKITPYVRPLYDALYDMMEAEVIEDHLETGIIEIAPLAYMRGRTLNNAFVILDEAQNCTSEQLKMFLTRLGFDSKMVITGDITQSDLPGGKPIGLIEAVKILKPVKGIQFVSLTKSDVVRHSLIQKIIQAYEDFYKEENV